MTAPQSVASNFPDPFPASWASAWGEDEYGLWMTLEYGGAEQTFRWIEPGTFLMGSLDDEPERSDDEVQHQATLTRGYWLADTVCTQALWVAMMGENPSRFADDPENPVESVSWDDVQGFIAQLNTNVEGLHARLPTESEWEYACRAATESSFGSGNNLLSQKWHRRKALFVRDASGALRQIERANARPANPWGLHGMLSPTWEWCADWYGLHNERSVIDPTGPAGGSRRVLRGGASLTSLSNSGNARCGTRIANIPSQRVERYGFRLALGPGDPPGR